MSVPRLGYPDLGFGIGLRTPHIAQILREKPAIDWFEIISENFMDSGGRPSALLDQIAERYPIVMHGVSLSIGSTDPLNVEYVKKIKRLADRTRAVWISDHLCWTGVNGKNSHDLLPLPLNEESLRHVSDRVRHVQDLLGRPLVLENPSSYVAFKSSDMTEPEFLSRLCEQTGCGLLLDVNNVYVTSMNLGLDQHAYLRSIPIDRVVQFHLAGHSDMGTHLIDTHDGPVCDAVWELYDEAVRLIGPVSTLIEWDAKLPSLDAVWSEALKAKARRTERVPIYA